MERRNMNNYKARMKPLMLAATLCASFGAQAADKQISLWDKITQRASSAWQNFNELAPGDRYAIYGAGALAVTGLSYLGMRQALLNKDRQADAVQTYAAIAAQPAAYWFASARLRDVVSRLNDTSVFQVGRSAVRENNQYLLDILRESRPGILGGDFFEHESKMKNPFDGIKDFQEGTNVETRKCNIIDLMALCQTERVVAVFQELSPAERVERMKDLLRCPLRGNNELRRLSVLREVLNRFELYANRDLQEAFFARRGQRTWDESWFSAILHDARLSVNVICSWFPKNQPDLNKRRLIDLLNRDTFLRSELCKQKILEICRYIEFDQWDKVWPDIRKWLDHGSWPEDVRKLNDFFRGKTIDGKSLDYNEQEVNMSIEYFRQLKFEKLREIEKSDGSGSLATALFLANNMHLYGEARCHFERFIMYERGTISEDQKAEYVGAIAKYILSLGRYCQDCDSCGYETQDGLVQGLLNVCLASGDLFDDVCTEVLSAYSYDEFVNLSSQVLRDYMKAYPADLESIRNSTPQDGMVVDSYDEDCLDELEIRKENTRIIEKLLSRGQSLFGMLLDHCDTKGWLNNAPSVVPTCSSSGV